MRLPISLVSAGVALWISTPRVAWTVEARDASPSREVDVATSGLSTAPGPDPSSGDKTRLVMTWVPPYAVENCHARLSETYDGVGMADALTHLALQFWVPTRGGGLARAGRTNVTTDAAIAAFRDWGHTNGVKVLLCLFNGGRTWDWSLAQAGFIDHPDTLIDALLTEVRRHGLDGVDLDLEGRTESQADREAFVTFVRRLSDLLHQQGDQLTVDSFAYKWNVPNHSWWPELLPVVDGLTTMGYEQTGSAASKWRGYAFQQAAAGDYAHKLMIGLPSHVDGWQGQPLRDHLDWFTTNGVVGVSIWDAQLRSGAWREAGVWHKLGRIRGFHQPGEKKQFGAGETSP